MMDEIRITLMPNTRLIVDHPEEDKALWICNYAGAKHLEANWSWKPTASAVTINADPEPLQDSSTAPLPPHMAVDLEQDAPFIGVLAPFSGHAHEDC